MKPITGLALAVAILGAAFYLYTALAPRTGAQYAQAKGMFHPSGPAIPQTPQNQGR